MRTRLSTAISSPWQFRNAGLGPLIGKKSWGGVTGITSHGPLIDGGSVNVPEFGFADVNGNYVIEGEGVEPDIEVDNDPASVIAGRDPQLERAIEEVLNKIEANPPALPGTTRGSGQAGLEQLARAETQEQHGAMILSRSGRRPRRPMSINSPVAQRYRDNEFLFACQTFRPLVATDNHGRRPRRADLRLLRLDLCG